MTPKDEELLKLAQKYEDAALFAIQQHDASTGFLRLEERLAIAAEVAPALAVAAALRTRTTGDDKP
jgi:threonine dehydratase